MRLNRRKIELFFIDTLIFVAVYIAMVFLDLLGISSMMLNDTYSPLKAATLYILIMGLRLCAGVYHNIWRYASIDTYLRLVVADILGGTAFFLLGRGIDALNLGFSFTLLTLFSLIIATLISRFLYQVTYAHNNRVSDAYIPVGEEDIHKINIAIIGAGNVGASLAAELRRNPKSHYTPICFVDTDQNKIGGSVNGLPVYREDERIVSQLRRMPVQEVVIALPDASPEDKERLYNLYKKTGCKVKLYDYLISDDGKPAGEQKLREFSIEDLLFRDSIDINSDAAKAYYAGKTVLITGGGGSIGAELCRQIASLEPKLLAILDIYENNAYDIQQELIRKHGSKLNLDVIIASVRDVKRMDEVFREIRPDIVFHAAAHKHVPLMERNCSEAIKNNVMGTYNTANMAEKYGAQKFILISTDKAVNPTNIMGASKRLCEMIIQCRTDSKCEFAAVRFGNVLGSNGSVIPLFKKQIAAGGPITLTDHRIIRYFMTIPEAVGLVMEAGAMAHKGELFVLDMGKPVRILDLAENMIYLSGLRPYEDIDIKEIGLRPGEKLFEELLMQSEELTETANKLIFIEKDTALTRRQIDDKIDILMRAVQQEGYDCILQAVRDTVPTFRDPDEVNQRAIDRELAQAAAAAAKRKNYVSDETAAPV